MAEASTSSSTTLGSEEAVGLAQKTLAANQALQHELAQRAEQLELEILEADRLLEALENGTDPEDAEDEIQIPGARRAFSLFPLSECLNEESPLYNEARKRVDFLARITPQSFNPKQLEALRNAVRSENQRLQACRKQEGNQEPVDLDMNVDGIDWSIVAEKVSDISSDKFTADQCRIKWIGSHSPTFNHSEWKTPETNKLFEILRATPTGPDSRVDWVKVTNELGTHRTVADVANRGQLRQRHLWDQESDALLLRGVEKYGVNNWAAIARDVADKVTPTQCQNRYNKSLDPGIKRGAWTAVEDERLKKAVAAIGTSWVRVAEYVPGRTNDQCNERWTAQLNAGSSKNVWSEEEDRKLIEMVNSEGRQWKAISEKIGNGKNGPSCRLRFNKLTKSTMTSTSGLVMMSPAPGTSSATPSLPSATPREMSVQTEFPTGSAVAEGSNASIPLELPSVQPTASLIEHGGAALTAKGRGKKHANPTGEDEILPAPKRQKATPKAITVQPTMPEHDDANPSQSMPKTARPAPKPRPKPKGKVKATPEASQTAGEQSSSQASVVPPHESPATTSGGIEPAPPRRSARFASGKGAGGS